MSDLACAIAADTKIETPEGPLTAKGLATKAAPVFTLENGRVRFRMLRNPRLVATSAPVVQVTLDNGQSFRAGTAQLVFTTDMLEVRASELQPGDALVPMFSFPAGYAYQDDRAQTQKVSDATTRVASVCAAGEADVYAFDINITGCFFVSAGVLCKASGS